MSFEPEKYISPQRASDMPVSPLEKMPDFSDFRRQNAELSKQNDEPNSGAELNSSAEFNSDTALNSSAETEPYHPEIEAKRAIEILNQIKDQMMRHKSHLIADSHQFDAAFRELDELIHSEGHIDPELARAGLDKLLQAQEALTNALVTFNSSNTDYLKQTLLYRKTIGEDSYQREYGAIEDNKDQADSVYRKMQARADEIQSLWSTIRMIEENLWL